MKMNDEDKIKQLRRHIDRIDIVIITALAERMSLMPDVADYKKKNDLSVFDEEREVEIMKKLKNIAKEQGLEESFVEEIFLSCFNESKRIQNDVINNSKPE